MIAVVDYQKGNLKSVERGLIAAGGEAFITADASEIAKADAIVLPGVGAFADAAATMCELGQMDVIRERVRAGVPFLGICLGEHLMFERGVEARLRAAPHADWGFCRAPSSPCREAMRKEKCSKCPMLGGTRSRCLRVAGALQSFRAAKAGEMPCSRPVEPGEVPRAVPQRSEDCLSTAPSPAPQPGSDPAFACPLFDGIAPGEYFYFTHSYIAPTGSHTIAETTHSVRFTSAVQYGDRAFGVQFHPEKSSDAGARVLANFVAIAARG